MTTPYDPRYLSPPGTAGSPGIGPGFGPQQGAYPGYPNTPAGQPGYTSGQQGYPGAEQGYPGAQPSIVPPRPGSGSARRADPYQAIRRRGLRRMAIGLVVSAVGFLIMLVSYLIGDHAVYDGSYLPAFGGIIVILHSFQSMSNAISRAQRAKRREEARARRRRRYL